MTGTQCNVYTVPSHFLMTLIHHSSLCYRHTLLINQSSWNSIVPTHLHVNIIHVSLNLPTAAVGYHIMDERESVSFLLSFNATLVVCAANRLQKRIRSGGNGCFSCSLIEPDLN